MNNRYDRWTNGQLFSLIYKLHVICFAEFITAGLPVFLKDPQNQYINNNDKAKFECFANGSNATIIITWEKDRGSYTSGVIQDTTHSNGVSSSLTLNKAKVTDSGKYRCRATDVDGNSTTSMEAELLSRCSVNVSNVLSFDSSPTYPHQPQ